MHRLLSLPGEHVEYFRDGLGGRVLRMDQAGGPVEVLRLCRDLAAMRGAVRHRFDRLATLRLGPFPHLRAVGSPPDDSFALEIVSDRVPGARLLDVLELASAGRLTIETDAALHIVRQLLGALAALHESRGVTHGAIGPERLVVTPRGQVMVMDYVLGAALEQLGYAPTRLWMDFRIPMPLGGGTVRFDARADVAQVGAVALALLAGRPLSAEDYPERMSSLIDSLGWRGGRDASRPLLEGVGDWLRGILLPGARKGPSTARKAQAALEAVITRCRDSSPAASPLKTLLDDYHRARDAAIEGVHETAAVPGPALHTAPSLVLSELPLEPGPESGSSPDVQPVAGDACVAVTPAAIVDTAHAESGDAGLVSGPQPGVPGGPFPVPALSRGGPGRSVGEAGSRVLRSAGSAAAGAGVAVGRAVRSGSLATLESAAAAGRTVAAGGTGLLRGANSAAVGAARALGGVGRLLARAGGGILAFVALAGRAFAGGSTALVRAAAGAAVGAARALAGVGRWLIRAGWGATRATARATGFVWRAVSTAGSAGARQTGAALVVAGRAARIAGRGSLSASTGALLLGVRAARVLAACGNRILRWALRGGFQALRVAGGVGVAAAWGAVDAGDRGIQCAAGGARRMRDVRVSRPVVTIVLVAVLAWPGVLVTRAWWPWVREQRLPRVGEWVTPGATAPPAVPGTGAMDVRSDPPGAEIWLDGALRGRTPSTIEDVPEGSRQVVLRSAAGRVQTTVNVRAAEIARVTLPIYSGWIAVFAPVELQILEGGAAVGTTADGRILVSPGRHVLDLVSDRYGCRERRTADVKPGEVTALNVALAPSHLEVDAPAGAELWLDGRLLGTAPIGPQTVPVGTSVIVMRHPTLGEQSRTVTVACGPLPTRVAF